MKEMEDRLRAVFGNVNDWLKFAEAKNGAVMAFAGASAFAVLKIIADVYPAHYWISKYLFLFLIFDCLALIAGMLSFIPKISIPGLTNSQAIKDSDNLLFFGDIAKYAPSNYLTAFHEAAGAEGVRPSRVEFLYAEQIVVNSTIAVRKYKFFKVGAWCIFSAVLTPAVSLILYLSFRER